MTTQKKKINTLQERVQKLLLESPGLTIKEIAKVCGINRQFMAGYLIAMEERGEVFSRKVGPARIYFNHKRQGENK